MISKRRDESFSLPQKLLPSRSRPNYYSLVLVPLGSLVLLFPGPTCLLLAQDNPQQPAPAVLGSKESQAPESKQGVVGTNEKRAGVYRVGGGVTAPKAVFAPDPEYSEEARKAHYQGTEVLWLVVDAKGMPQNIRVQRSLGMGLDEEAIKAIKLWRFEPAQKDGQPVAVMINIEINFRLYDSLSPHRRSAEQPPIFPGVDNSKYPLVLHVKTISFAGTGSSATANHEAILTDAGRQRELTISCIVDSSHCLNLELGNYPARWQDDKTLEILGLNGKQTWKATEYMIAVQ